MEIINYTEINKNSLKAKFDVVIPEWGGLIIKEVLLFQKSPVEQWISLPGKSYKSKKDGSTKVYPLIQFDKKVMEKIQIAIIAKLKSGKIHNKPVTENNTPF